MQKTQVLKLTGLWRKRGRAVARHSAAVTHVMDGTTVDISSIAGPALLLNQSYAKAQVEAIAFVMADPEYPGLSLDDQGELARLLSLWWQIRASLGSIAFTRRLPTFTALVANIPEASRFGSNTEGVLLASWLEHIANVGGIADVSVKTFWTVSARGREALGRLASMDMALRQHYDFDVLVEDLACLMECAPMTVDAQAIVDRINTASRDGASLYQEPSVLRAFPATIPDNTSLSTLAQIILGDAERWRDIADYNKLRAPYISDDPIDQLGDLERILTLTAETPTGTSILHVTDVFGITVDERVRVAFPISPSKYGAFQLGGAFQKSPAFQVTSLAREGFDEIRTIIAVDTVNKTITVDHPYPRTIPVSADVTVYLYPAIYDVPGRVARPGETVLIPMHIGEIPAGATLTDSRDRELVLDRIYGEDVLTSEQEDLVLDEPAGDLMLTAGIPNLKQAIRHRFKVPRGTYILHPQYGNGLEAMIGMVTSQYREALAGVDARQTVLADPRILKIGEVTVEAIGDTFAIDVTATTKNNEQFPSTRIALSLTR